MTRSTLRIRIWLTLVVTAAASLVLASSASAMLNAGDAAGPAVTPQVPVVANPSGFDWTAAAIGAAVAIAVALAAIGVAYVARNRSRLAASH